MNTYIFIYLYYIRIFPYLCGSEPHVAIQQYLSLYLKNKNATNIVLHTPFMKFVRAEPSNVGNYVFCCVLNLGIASKSEGSSRYSRI